MSRLHALRATIDDVAARFGAEPAADVAIPSETIEGQPGVIVIERDDRRFIRSMRWGFPRPDLRAAIRGDQPGLVGLVADLTNPMWERMVEDPKYRCLIPITHFANPDGAAGAKTRTWFSVIDQPIVAWAGFCRNVPGTGAVYAGMTMTANAAIPPTNDRMPVLLEPDEQERWLHGTIQDVIRFQFRPPFAPERLRVERTDDRWRSGAAPPSVPPQLALL